MPKKKVYKIIFRNHDQLIEVYASGVSQGSIFGFIEVEELLFGERSQVVVDPSEDALKNEFKGVTRTLIPLHAIIRIDEVEKQGVGRIARAKGDGNLMVFPTPIPPEKGPKPRK